MTVDAKIRLNTSVVLHHDTLATYNVDGELVEANEAGATLRLEDGKIYFFPAHMIMMIRLTGLEEEQGND